MDFDDAVEIVDQKADERLGNSVEYSTDAGGTYPVIKAYVIVAAEAMDGNGEFGNLDPINHGDRLKVKKTIVPVPDKSHIVRHPKLPAPMRPENWQSVEGGRYWMIDLQKA